MSDTYVLLTSVGPKPFLNIDCNNITCNILTANEVIDLSAVSSLFCYTQAGAVNLNNSGATTQSLDTVVISNPNFNLATNVFTAPIAGNYRFDVSFNLANTTPATVIGLLSLIYNGVLVNIPAGICSFPGPAVGQLINTVSLSFSQPMAMGDTMGYRLFNANSAVNTMNCTNGKFMGQLY